MSGQVPPLVLRHADLFSFLPTLARHSIDAGVMDPPYGIGFMGREWDTFKPEVSQRLRVLGESWTKRRPDNPNLNGRRRQPGVSPSAVPYDLSLSGLRRYQDWTARWGAEVLRVLKPGAHLLVCGFPRSYHRMACGLEDAGFEVRDTFAWLFGSGFPKSLTLAPGVGTALKPNWEPILLARAPLAKGVKATYAAHGTGGLQIGACRLDAGAGGYRGDEPSAKHRYTDEGGTNLAMLPGPRGGSELGRWPGDVLIDDLVAEQLDASVGPRRSGEGPSRFFYCPKASRAERDFGLEDLPAITGGQATGRRDGSKGVAHPRAGAGRTGGARNVHPTTKPIALMRWLVRLVTPPGGTVIDPFLGSGSTAVACVLEGVRCIGSDRERLYVDISRRRSRAAQRLIRDQGVA